MTRGETTKKKIRFVNLCDADGLSLMQRIQQLQGTLLVTLRNSVSNQPIDDNEVRRKFQQFGDVKAVRAAGEREEYVSPGLPAHSVLSPFLQSALR